MLVSLTFDDGNEPQYTNFYPVLEEYGVKATFYVITSQINMPGKLGWSQLKDLCSHGNEIGSHTHTHPHLTRLSDDVLNFELCRSRNILKRFNIRTLAYPYGDCDRRVIHYAEKYYQAARGYYDPTEDSHDYWYNPVQGLERYRLKSFPAERDPSLDVPLLKLPFSQYESFVRRIFEGSVQRGAWVILVFHGQSMMTFNRVWWAFRNRKITVRSVISFVSSMKYVRKRGIQCLETVRKLRWLCEYLTFMNSEALTVSEAVDRLCAPKSI